MWTWTQKRLLEGCGCTYCHWIPSRDLSLWSHWFMGLHDIGVPSALCRWSESSFTLCKAGKHKAGKIVRLWKCLLSKHNNLEVHPRSHVRKPGKILVSGWKWDTWGSLAWQTSCLLNANLQSAFFMNKMESFWEPRFFSGTHTHTHTSEDLQALSKSCIFSLPTSNFNSLVGFLVLSKGNAECFPFSCTFQIRF